MRTAVLVALLMWLCSCEKKVSYKAEYKKHLAMIDSICAGKVPCDTSLGFAEYFDQKTGKTIRIEDLWHKNIILTIP